MSVPTIVVSPTAIPTSFQIATPFSYTFSNSSTYAPLIAAPSYTVTSIGAVSNTSPYSATDSLLYTTGLPNSNIAASGGVVYATSNISNNSVFEFTLPYPSSGGMSGAGNMYFITAAQASFSNVGYNVRINSGTYYSYVAGDSIRYTYNGGNSFSVVIKRAAGDISFGPYTSVTSAQFNMLGVTWPSAGTQTTVEVKAPNYYDFARSTYPYLSVSSLTSTEFLPYLAGSGTTQVTLASATGFQGIPSSNLRLWIDQTYNGSNIGSNVTSNIVVSPISITVTPTLTSPLSLITYQPFAYSYSIPANLVGVVLQPNSNTQKMSSSLLPYIAADGTSFSSTVGLTTAGITNIEIDAVLNGSTILASNVAVINTTATGVTATPAIPTGSLNLYKYEPFSYVFTTNPLSSGITLRFTASSSELQAFCSVSADGQTVTFAGTSSVSYASTLTLRIDTMYGTTVAGGTTILIAINSGRFFPPSLNQNYQLYQYENVSNTFGGSNPVFTSATEIDSILTSPSLPTGLLFSNVSSNTYWLTGVPALQVAQTNYQVIGSNSSNGRIVTTTISIKVNQQLVRVSPSSVTLAGITVGTSITPATFTSIQPQTFGSSFSYTWSSLPDGFSFQYLNGSNFPYGGTPTDPALSIVLVGTPTLAFAKSMKTVNAYQTRLYGSQGNTTGSAVINFSFGETVLIDVSNAITLYQKKMLGTNDVVITAGSYFSSTQLSNVTATSLPPGLAPLVQTITPSNYSLTGTPTVVNLAGSYTFTATNFNGISRSVTASLPVYPDIVTFGGGTPSDGSVITFIVSRPLTNPKDGYYTTPIQFSATSAASSNPLVYSSSIALSTYGLSLNSSTGTVTGIPNASLPQTTVTIYATDEFQAVGSTTIQLTIAPDVFTWPVYTPTYFQNRTITPYQFVMVSTLSDRPIQTYSSPNLPDGLILNPSGLLSGAPTGSSGTFTITASTGYSVLSQPYTYTVISDLLLTIEVGGSTNVTSKIFSNVLYQTIQYSTSTFVNPTYTVTDLQPPQAAPLPVITISPSGVMSADFTNGLVASYTGKINSTYGTASGSTPVVFTFNKLTVPILAAAYSAVFVPEGDVAGGPIGYVTTARSYVFPGPVSQSWNNKISVTCNASMGPYVVSSPDISRIGSNYVACGTDDPGLTGVYTGVYNSTVEDIVWSTDFIESSGIASYPGIANDGLSNWVIASLPYPSIASNTTGIWTRTGFNPGTWTLATRITTTTPVLGYMSPNFILGNSGLTDTYDCNANRVQYANKSDLTTWTTASVLPGFSNILRFTTSNTTVVAIGSGAPVGVFPLAYSTDSGATWSNSTTTLANLKGSNVILRDLVYANNTWVMCGVDSNLTSFLAYSSNLSNWSIYSNVTPYNWTAVAFNGNAWSVAGSSNGPTEDGYVSVSKLLTLDASAWPTQSYSIDTGTLFSNIDPGYEIKFNTTRLLANVYQSTTPVTGTVYVPNNSDLVFVAPATSAFTFFQYVPYSIPVQAVGSSSFIYYFTASVPIGFSFTPDPMGVTASVDGISPSNGTTQTVTVYAKTLSGNPTYTTFSINTIIPFFINPQTGAGAYTALLRNEVEANAAQNARDNRTFPQVDPLAGPFMAPRAPDVTTPDDCQLQLCKKPCPTCRSML